MKKFLFGTFAAVCAAFSLAAVNVNTASSAELEALPGIGPAKAKVLNKLKAEATVSSAAPKAAQPAVKK